MTWRSRTFASKASLLSFTKMVLIIYTALTYQMMFSSPGRPDRPGPRRRSLKSPKRAPRNVA